MNALEDRVKEAEQTLQHKDGDGDVPIIINEVVVETFFESGERREREKTPRGYTESRRGNVVTRTPYF